MYLYTCMYIRNRRGPSSAPDTRSSPFETGACLAGIPGAARNEGPGVEKYYVKNPLYGTECMVFMIYSISIVYGISYIYIFFFCTIYRAFISTLDLQVAMDLDLQSTQHSSP